MTGQSGSGPVGSDNMRMFGSGQKNPGGIQHQSDEKGLQATCKFYGVVKQEKVDFLYSGTGLEVPRVCKPSYLYSQTKYYYKQTYTVSNFGCALP